MTRASGRTASSSSSPTRIARSGTAEEIDEGLRVLRRAEALRRPGPYQLQAAIAAGHAEGAEPGVIAGVYAALLERLDPSPVVRLNHAVAVALAGDVEGGLALIDGIEGLDGYSYLPAARADLLRRLGSEPGRGARATARRSRSPTTRRSGGSWSGGCGRSRS